MKISSIILGMTLMAGFAFANDVSAPAAAPTPKPAKVSSLENAVIFLTKCNAVNPEESLSLAGLKVEILNVGLLLKRSGDTSMLVRLTEQTGQSNDMMIFLKKISFENEVYKFTFDTNISNVVAKIEISRAADNKGQLVKVEIPETEKTTSASYVCNSPMAAK